MATILKICDVDEAEILEVTPPAGGVIRMYIGIEGDDQSWRDIALNKEDASDLIEYLQSHLSELK